MNALGTETIITARITLVFVGYGDLTLTNSALIWNKSVTSVLAFGVSNVATDNNLTIYLKDIAKVDKYTYFPGGGLIVTTNDGKIHKMAFKHKKEFNAVYEYLTTREANDD